MTPKIIYIYGDCMRASLCSLLEISDENVPNFAEYDEDTYHKMISEFLYSKGYRLIYTETIDDIPSNIEYFMAMGLSPRGNNHAVIYNRNGLIHDPHPFGGGINPSWFAWLRKRN